MNSVLYQIYFSHFHPSNQTEHQNEVLQNRMKSYQNRFSKAIQQTKNIDQQEQLLHIMEALVKDQINSQPEMFALGFSLGAQLMIEVLTCE